MVCDTLFGKNHNRSTNANAFRHALWNIFLCKETMKRTNSTNKSIQWAEKTTQLYEEVTQNSLLEKQMDLHNNEFGRMLFLTYFDKNEAKLIGLLQKEMENSQKVNNIEEMEFFKKQLIYLE